MALLEAAPKSLVIPDQVTARHVLVKTKAEAEKVIAQGRVATQMAGFADKLRDPRVVVAGDRDALLHGPCPRRG